MQGRVITKDTSRIDSDMSHPAPHQLTDMVRKRYRVHTVNKAGRIKTMRFMEQTLKEGTTVTVVGPVTEDDEGILCFERMGGTLLVSERDVTKEGRKTRKRAIGWAVAAGAFLVVSLGLVITSLVL